MATVDAAFEAELAAAGYSVAEEKSVPPGTSLPHAHPFDVRARVLQGAITLETDGAQRTYGVGDVFTMAAHHPHAEIVGPEGVRYLVGRRHKQA